MNGNDQIKIKFNSILKKKHTHTDVHTVLYTRITPVRESNVKTNVIYCSSILKHFHIFNGIKNRTDQTKFNL